MLLAAQSLSSCTPHAALGVTIQPLLMLMWQGPLLKGQIPVDPMALTLGPLW